MLQSTSYIPTEQEQTKLQIELDADVLLDFNKEQRAASVKNWFVKNGGVASARITTKGLGETKPVALNSNPDGSDNPEGRQKNRRVDIKIKTGG